MDAHGLGFGEHDFSRSSSCPPISAGAPAAAAFENCINAINRIVVRMKIPKNLGEAAAAALDDLPAKLSRLAAKANHVLTSVGEEGFELVVALLVMILVERVYGQQGLGIYAYLTACLYAARYLANFGVTRYVEIEAARLTDDTRRKERIGEAYQAVLFTALAGALILLVSSGFDTSHTRIHERLGAYIIIALALPMGNLNSLKLAAMQGLGQHARVARLRMLRHGLILAAMLFLTRAGVAPSYLLAAYLVADIVTAAGIRRHLKLPGFRTAFKQPRKAWETLRQGRTHLFTDNALDLLLNIDLFVLGLFVSAWDLGVYAEAAVLVRFFLIISLGVKPILRRQYALLAAQEQISALKAAFRRHNAYLFCLQAVLALVTLLYFPLVLDLFFELRGETSQSFKIFLVFVPGLIFYAVFSAQEPVYEALDRSDDLKRLTLITAGANLLLALYLVPAAGIYGAAAATMITMLIHFFLFGRPLNMGPELHKVTFMAAALALYLVYTLLDGVALGPSVNFWLGPMLLLLGFYGCGVFGVE